MPPNLNSHVMSHAVFPDDWSFQKNSILKFLYIPFEKGAR